MYDRRPDEAQCCVAIAFRGASWTDPDSVPLMVMQTMLGEARGGGGRGGRAGRPRGLQRIGARATGGMRVRGEGGGGGKGEVGRERGRAHRWLGAERGTTAGTWGCVGLG